MLTTTDIRAAAGPGAIVIDRRRPRPEGRVTPPDLDDERQFRSRSRVPILDVHEHPSKGNVDEADLDLLAANSERRARKGNYALVFIGHTDDDGPEDLQPELVGYARNFVVGAWQGRPCLLADLYFLADRFAKAMSYPHRSVERSLCKSDPSMNFIDAVSLLRRPPERDLGLLTYGRDRDDVRTVRYERDLPPLGEAQAAGPTTPTPVPEEATMPESGTFDVNTLVSTLIVGLTEALGKMMPQMIRAALHEEAALNEPVSEPAPAEPPAAEPAADAVDDLDDEQYEAGEGGGAGEPGPTNAFVPSDEPEEERMSRGTPPARQRYNADCGPDQDPDQETRRMARTQEGITVARYERRLKAAEAKNARLEGQVRTLVRNARKAERERDLTALLAEGYQFTLADEVADVVDMADADYGRHLNRIRTRYARDPVGGDFVPPAPEVPAAEARNKETAPAGGGAATPAADDEDAGLPPITADDYPELVRYQRDNKLVVDPSDHMSMVNIVRSFRRHKRDRAAGK